MSIFDGRAFPAAVGDDDLARGEPAMLRFARLLHGLLVVGTFLLVACSDRETDKQRYLDSGNAYASEQRYQDAIVQYRNAIGLDPKFGHARFKLAQAYEETKDLQRAFREFIRAADLLPDDRGVQLKAVGVLLSARRFEDAKTRAEALLKRNPQDVNVMLARANALADLKDADGAIGEIEEALKVGPDNSLTYLNLGAIQLAQGNALEAEAAFKTALTLNPSSAQAHVALANFLWSTDRAKEAEAALKQALAIDAQHSLANRMLAALYLTTERPSEAEAPLKAIAEATKTGAARLMLADYYVASGRLKQSTEILKGLAADPATSRAADMRLAQIDYSEGRRDEAHKRLDALIARAPSDAAVLTLKAQWLGQENQLDKALVRAKAAVAADPQSAAAHYVLGMAQGRRREVADAIKSFTEVLRLNPRAVQAQVELSQLSLAAGQSEAALNYATQAKTIDPTNAAARIALVRSQFARRDLAAAGAEVAVLVKTLPQNATVHALNGTVQGVRGESAAARQSFERALELSPGLTEAISGMLALDLRAKRIPQALARIEAELTRRREDPELLALAARVHDAAQNSAKAEQLLRRAVTADPRFLTGYAMLAQRYMAERRLDQARAEFETIVKHDPSSVQARTMVGVLLEVQNKKDEARKWYEATVALTDRAPIVANNLAFLYAESGTNLNEALDLAKAAKQQLPDHPSVDDTLGWVYYKRDMANLAIQPLEQSVRKDPGNALYHYHLGLAYLKTGDKDKARAALQQALNLQADFDGAAEARKALSSLPN